MQRHPLARADAVPVCGHHWYRFCCCLGQGQGRASCRCLKRGTISARRCWEMASNQRRSRWGRPSTPSTYPGRSGTGTEGCDFSREASSPSMRPDLKAKASTPQAGCMLASHTPPGPSPCVRDPLPPRMPSWIGTLLTHIADISCSPVCSGRRAASPAGTRSPDGPAAQRPL